MTAAHRHCRIAAPPGFCHRQLPPATSTPRRPGGASVTKQLSLATWATPWQERESQRTAGARGPAVPRAPLTSGRGLPGGPPPPHPSPTFPVPARAGTQATGPVLAAWTQVKSEGWRRSRLRPRGQVAPGFKCAARSAKSADRACPTGDGRRAGSGCGQRPTSRPRPASPLAPERSPRLSVHLQRRDARSHMVTGGQPVGPRRAREQGRAPKGHGGVTHKAPTQSRVLRSSRCCEHPGGRGRHFGDRPLSRQPQLHRVVAQDVESCLGPLCLGFLLYEMGC